LAIFNAFVDYILATFIDKVKIIIWFCSLSVAFDWPWYRWPWVIVDGNFT